MEKRNKFLGMSNLSSIRERSLKNSKRNDAILVVAVLIVTATYQVGLSPPDGVWQESSSNPTTAKNVHHAGQMTMSFNMALFFSCLQRICFPIISLCDHTPHNWTPNVEVDLWVSGGFKCRYVSIIRYYIPNSIQPIGRDISDHLHHGLPIDDSNHVVCYFRGIHY
ncbi:hypothetical protein F2Q70_00014853 [Brassica cretica]|uniref:PGG domain-containing protein n=1 Tax=Brassica cretica TaxID=69181 RepID=A0A8S9HVH9_BRACR|nr:hypothetical protein F2Q70_00014853 [Brassica cretica]